MGAYEIERGIPMPTSTGPKKWEQYFPFIPYMKVGDSFFIPITDDKVYMSVPYVAAKKMNIHLHRKRMVDPVKGDGHRVWRVK